jgi:chemotaxis protein CheD
MAQLIQRMCRAGARAERLEGSVIGGGQPVDAIPDTSIGDQNAGLAMAVLREHRIRVVRQDTGGRFGRKLLFNTGTGELIVRRLGAAGVRQAERAWR